MKAGRLALATCMIALCGIPLILPFGEAFFRISPPFSDTQNLLSLARNTFLLVAGTLALAVPIGVLLAILFFRTDLPGRSIFLIATAFALFIPLPLVLSAWQASIGNDGLLPLWFWGANADRPWSAGLIPAIWVQALAAMPWVILIVGVGLSSVEKTLEEEALLAAGPWRVLWLVTLPRCRGAIAAAALWVGLQTAADIGVTDMLLVPTFAEEIHTQFTMGGSDALARTLLIAFPGVILTWLLLLVLVPYLERSLPSLQLDFGQLRAFSLGKTRWPWGAVCLVAWIALFFVPLGSLVWKLGLAGVPRTWSPLQAGRQFMVEIQLYGLQVGETIAVALLTGACTAMLALLACWGVGNQRLG